jgi:hypothetical protein
MKARQITALFTLVAMLIAPLCAPFCHSHVCAASSAAEQNDDCHKSSAANANTTQISLAAVHNCGLQELPTVTISEATNSPNFVKRHYAQQIALHFVSPPTVLLGASDAASPHPESESRIQSISVRPSVLRI